MSPRNRIAAVAMPAGAIGWLSAVDTAVAQDSDGGLPTTFGFVLGLVMLVAVLVGIPIGTRVLHRRRARPARLPALGPGVELDAIHAAGLSATALRAETDRLLREVQAAWDAGDTARLLELVTPRLAREWLPRVEAGETLEWADEVRVVGSVDVAILGLTGGEVPRGTLEVQTRLSGSLDHRAIRADPAARRRVMRGERAREQELSEKDSR